MKVTVDHAALQRIISGREGRAVAHRAAERVADEARSEGIRVGDLVVDGVGTQIDIPVKTYETDEGARVVLAHPAGIAVQAKHGTLTRAASAVGLKVRG